MLKKTKTKCEAMIDSCYLLIIGSGRLVGGALILLQTLYSTRLQTILYSLGAQWPLTLNFRSASRPCFSFILCPVGGSRDRSSISINICINSSWSPRQAILFQVNELYMFFSPALDVTCTHSCVLLCLYTLKTAVHVLYLQLESVQKSSSCWIVLSWLKWFLSLRLQITD